MNRPLKKAVLTFLCVAALLLPNAARAQRRAVVQARGEYLAILGDCAGCHSSKTGSPLIGGVPFTGAFGTVYSSNITPDPASGIGNWSDEEFYRALHNGIDNEGRHLYPAFPYPYFVNITRLDSDVLFAYLRMQPAVRSEPPPNSLRFPFKFRSLLTIWNALFLPSSTLAIDNSQSEEWNRGRFIVEGPGHCGGCHTPKNWLFAPQTDRNLQGGVVTHWYAADLTSGIPGGLGLWQRDDIVKFLKTGTSRRATAVGLMQEVVSRSTSKMSDADLEAIAIYLKSLPAQQTGAPTQPSVDTMSAGQAIYLQRCSICHDTPDKVYDAPSLKLNTLVQAQDPTTVLHVILKGSQSMSLENHETRYSMPAFATLNDSEIATVATYIRNSWGNHAASVQSTAVRKLRTALRDSEAAAGR